MKAQLLSQGVNPGEGNPGWEWELMAAMPMPASSKFQDLARTATLQGRLITRRSSAIRGRFAPCRISTPSPLEATRAPLAVGVDLDDGDVGGDLVDELVVQVPGAGHGVLWAHEGGFGTVPDPPMLGHPQKTCRGPAEATAP